LTDPQNNYVDVCGEKCTFLADKSDAQKAVCELPSVTTGFNPNEETTVSQIEDLWSGIYFGTGSTFF
jgi:hypothetical protein